MRSAIGLRFGRLDAAPVLWAVVCVLLSTSAMLGWSWWVGGEHGGIQETLGPIITPCNLVLLACTNAVLEEIDSRMFLLGSMLAGDAVDAPLWVGTAIVL